MSNRVYTIQISKPAKKVMLKLSRDLSERLTDAIDSLANDPRPVNCKKLAGRHDNLYRVRVGDWRISYAVHDDILLVLVVEVAPRGGAYRSL